MTSDQPKKRGFLNSIAQTMAPVPPEEGPDGTSKRPTQVVIALVLATLGGVLFLLSGLVTVTSIGGEAWNDSVDRYTRQHEVVSGACTTAVGGIGEAVESEVVASVPLVVTLSEESQEPATWSVEPSAVADTCRGIQPVADVIDAAETNTRMVGIAQAVIGVLAVLGAVLMRNGSVGMRRLLLVAVGLTLVLSLLFQASSTVFTLVGSLLMVVALILAYIGKGGGYFLFRSGGTAHS